MYVYMRQYINMFVYGFAQIIEYAKANCFTALIITDTTRHAKKFNQGLCLYIYEYTHSSPWISCCHDVLSCLVCRYNLYHELAEWGCRLFRICRFHPTDVTAGITLFFSILEFLSLTVRVGVERDCLAGSCRSPKQVLSAACYDAVYISFGCWYWEVTLVLFRWQHLVSHSHFHLNILVCFFTFQIHTIPLPQGFFLSCKEEYSGLC